MLSRALCVFVLGPFAPENGRFSAFLGQRARKKVYLFAQLQKAEKIRKKGLSFGQSARICLVKGQGMQQNHQCLNRKTAAQKGTPFCAAVFWLNLAVFGCFCFCGLFAAALTRLLRGLLRRLFWRFCKSANYGRWPMPPSSVRVSPFIYLKSGEASCTQTRPISSSASP